MSVAGPVPSGVTLLPDMPRPSAQMTLNVMVVVVAALYFARDVLVPLTLAVLLSILLAPLAGLLRRLRLGRVPSVLLAVLLAVTVVFGVGGLIGAQLASLAPDVPGYAQTIEHKADTLRSDTLGRIGRAASRLGYEPTPHRTGASPLDHDKDDQKPTSVEVHQPDPSPVDLAERYLSPVLAPIGTAGIVFIVTIFILLQQEDLRDRLIRLFGSDDLRRTTVALDDGGRRLSRYFTTQLAINTAFGVIIGVGVAWLGVPGALLWGVLGGLLRFVPYIGWVIAAAFPTALAAAVDPGWSLMLWCAGLFFLVEAAVGQAVEPFVYGRTTGLSPISVIVSAIFWSWLWGPIGLVLSTPLSLSLLVLGRHVERLAFLDVILGDRPVLTPIQTFYQRMLAADQDEARFYAEQMLKDRSLMAFYDEVALPGLELAAIDAQRGLLSAQQLEHTKETIKELVADLTDLDTGVPAEVFPGAGVIERPVVWRGPAPVLCVAGRGPLDEAAAAMLCQLLAQRGIGARVAPYEAGTRGNINLLDVEGVAMVCISYLDISGRQAHLRYLIQRLRQRMPDTPFVVGLWPTEDPGFREARVKAQLGGDLYIQTLAEGVEACVREAMSGRGRVPPNKPSGGFAAPPAIAVLD